MKVIPAGWTKEWAGGGRQVWTLRREPETVYELGELVSWYAQKPCPCCGHYHPTYGPYFNFATNPAVGLGRLGGLGSLFGGLGL